MRSRKLSSADSQRQGGDKRTPGQARSWARKRACQARRASFYQAEAERREVPVSQLIGLLNREFEAAHQARKRVRIEPVYDPWSRRW